MKCKNTVNIPMEMFDSTSKYYNLSTKAKLLYGVFRSLRGEENNEFQIGQDQLARILNTNLKTVRTAIKELVEIDLVEKHKIGLSQSNYYTVKEVKEYE